MTTIGRRPSTEAAVEWVQQHDLLWTGRLDGRPIGTIERGRRYTFVNPDGRARRGFRTLADAQLAHLVTAEDLEPTRPGSPRLDRMLMAATTVAAFGTVGLIAMAAPVLR